MLNNSLPSLVEIVPLAIILLVSFPAHELAHAFAADYFGDDTPRLHGRLTLNPFAHLDIFGALILLVTQRFGWAKPVPINEYTLMRRSRSAPAIVALAGPASNLVLGILGALPIGLGLVKFPQPAYSTFTLYNVLLIFSFINFILFFFNILPIYPLDGEKILVYLLRPEWQAKLLGFRKYQSAPLLILILVLPFLGIPILDWLVGYPARWLLGLFAGNI